MQRVTVAILVMAFVLVVATVSRADDGCPEGMLPSYEPGVCKHPSEYTALTLDDQVPMRFEAVQLSMTTIYIQATGLITADTPSVFAAFLETEDSKYSKDLFLHSSGGNLLAAMRLGQLIRQAGMNTSVGRSIPLEGITDVYRYEMAHCYSACTYAFLGGVTRSFDNADTFGVHRFGLVDGQVTSDDAQIVSGMLAGYIGDMGVDQRFLEAAASASFDGEIRLLGIEDARALRVIYDPSGQTSFQIEDSGGSAIAKFEFMNRERLTRGLILCADRAPYLVIIDSDDLVPVGLRAMDNYPATISANGELLQAAANYVAAEGASPGYLAFRIPGLAADSFSGTGLSLDNIQNPAFVGSGASNSEPVINDELIGRMMWQDAVSESWFTIISDNGERTLPLLLRTCEAS